MNQRHFWGETLEHKEHEHSKHERRSHLRLSDLHRMAEDVVRDHMHEDDKPKPSAKRGVQGRSEREKQER